MSSDDGYDEYYDDDVYNDDGHDDYWGEDNDSDDRGNSEDETGYQQDYDEESVESTERQSPDDEDYDGPCDLFSRYHLDDEEEEEDEGDYDGCDSGNEHQVHSKGSMTISTVLFDAFLTVQRSRV
jgi:hypothetical protein